MSQKILIVGQLPPPTHGSTVMAERFINALRNNGYETRIVQKTFSRKMDEVGKASLYKVVRIPGHCHDLLKAIREFKPDICVYFIAVGFTALVVDALLIEILIRNRIPYVLYFHGKGYQKYLTGSCNLRGYIIRKTLGRAAGGIVLGEKLKSDVSNYIPNERLFILPNGIPEMEKSTEKRNINSNVVHILFLSNLVRTKGPMEFLMMAKAVKEKAEKVRFTIAGRIADEKLYKEIMIFREREGLVDYVEITGPVYGVEKEALLMSADIFVFPTRKDVFPLVILEAMRSGIPVISSKEGAIPDIIYEGVNGYTVDSQDIDQLASRVLDLIRDPLLRKRMSRAGSDMYKKQYSIEAYDSGVGAAMNFFLSKINSFSFEFN